MRAIPPARIHSSRTFPSFSSCDSVDVAEPCVVVSRSGGGGECSAGQRNVNPWTITFGYLRAQSNALDRDRFQNPTHPQVYPAQLPHKKGTKGPQERKAAPVWPATRPTVRLEKRECPKNCPTNRARAGRVNPAKDTRLVKLSKLRVESVQS